ncbi:orotidine-5'-phosphate decarboxylase [Tengunoibacter tsumagoiensis]|uniref:Orotidine 5'-phosphate decarboxylase n=1 Tax=Tengunoibacter tsumagoiensis TaxID=2014871 RepID=A0A402A0F7_9CHLR|nr:orotidine-5'-phosphate decarboxylase [Tengunoibacter tsumagoiensis]GCE12638.1 orotidine 5'-phosphate decarboxylase [Tengunoibacter tsumagoiensis]
MSTVTFNELVEACWQRENFVCVGLDPEYERLPESVTRNVSIEEAFFTFCRGIIDATHDLVCAYKPNSAFFEAQGEAGLKALKRVVQYSKRQYPQVPIILDAKRADIGNTNRGYVTSAFDLIEADAVTVHPYLGKEALTPFLNRKEKGIIVLTRTSNPGAGEFQDLLIGDMPLYQVVARSVAQEWNTNGNCALVVGATYPDELRQVRSLIGDMPILIPGIGAQAGDVRSVVLAGQDSRGWGILLSSSRAILYASTGADFAQAARRATEELNVEINTYRIRPRVNA